MAGKVGGTSGDVNAAGRVHGRVKAAAPLVFWPSLDCLAEPVTVATNAPAKFRRSARDEYGAFT